MAWIKGMNGDWIYGDWGLMGRRQLTRSRGEGDGFRLAPE